MGERVVLRKKVFDPFVPDRRDRSGRVRGRDRTTLLEGNILRSTTALTAGGGGAGAVVKGTVTTPPQLYRLLSRKGVEVQGEDSVVSPEYQERPLGRTPSFRTSAPPNHPGVSRVSLGQDEGEKEGYNCPTVLHLPSRRETTSRPVSSTSQTDPGRRVPSGATPSLLSENPQRFIITFLLNLPDVEYTSPGGPRPTERCDERTTRPYKIRVRQDPTGSDEGRTY